MSQILLKNTLSHYLNGSICIAVNRSVSPTRMPNPLSSTHLSDDVSLDSDIDYDSIELTGETEERLELSVTEQEIADISDRAANLELFNNKLLREYSTEESSNSTRLFTKGPPPKRMKKVTMAPIEPDAPKAPPKQVVRLVPDLEDVHFFSKTHLELIHKNVVKVLKNEKNPNVKYDFCNQERGKYKFVCPNQDSKNFAMKIVPLLQELWADPKIKATDDGEIPRMVRASITFDNPMPEMLEFFEEIECKNDDIDTNEWRIYSRKKIQGNRTVTFLGVDEASVEKLRAVGFRPYYASSRIRINID